MDALALLDELRAMARTGLNYADDHHDRARYERLLELVETHYGDTLDLPPAEVRDRLADELGVVTPKVGANAAVFDDNGRALVLKRTDTGTWCLPGGHSEVRESPDETAVREADEETGLEVAVRGLVDIYQSPPTERWPYHMVVPVYVCEAVGGELGTSPESERVGYRHIEAVPDWLSEHEQRARDARDVWREKVRDRS